MTKEYVMVTTIQTFRHRYIVPVSALPDDGVSPTSDVMDMVTLDEVKEFSQEFLGEQIIDGVLTDQDKVLEMIDQEQPWIKCWTKEQKIDYMDAWNDDLDRVRVEEFQEKQERYHDYILRMLQQEDLNKNE